MQSTLASQQSGVEKSYGYQSIKDYAIIGDLHTVALVSKKGSVDWYCLPDIDSPSVFGRLLDCQKGGFFHIHSTDEKAEHEQLYYPDTNILLTRIATLDGMAEVTDFMPVKKNKTSEHSLIREVFVALGDLEMMVTCHPAFDYARADSTIILTDSGAFFCSPDLALFLSSSVRLRDGREEKLPLHEDGQGGVTTTFTLHEGDKAFFALNSLTASPQKLDLQKLDKKQCERLFWKTFHYLQLNKTQYDHLFWKTFHYWHDWLKQCTYQGRWREIVHRSALVLKLLTYNPTGAVVAAATTSLPEVVGGERNWDYRYTWLRDAAFTLDSLLNLGFVQEARAFMDWLDTCCDNIKPGAMPQPMYRINGTSADLEEQTLDHLEGYWSSYPVRIGNGASNQKQLDIYGELLDAISIYNRHEFISYDLWKHIQELLKCLQNHWDEPDRGIWEVRGEDKNFLHSRLMSWVAFDRAIRIASDCGWPADLHPWEDTRTAIYKQIMEKGVHNSSNKAPYFTQSYGNNVVDASTLLLLLTHFVGPRDRRMRGTLEQIKEKLALGPSILRYDPKVAADDGIPDKTDKTEGAFSACSFWFVQCQALMGDLDAARIRLERLLSFANHVGLYAEEIDRMGNPLGNFPQAFTHLTLIRACLTLDQAIEESLAHKH